MLFRPVRRSRLAALVTLALAVALLAANASTVSAAGGKPPAPPARDVPVKADRDNDKVFDDLETRLAAMSPHDELSVIVRLTVPTSAARVAELSQRVGDIAVTGRFAIVDGFAATVSKGQAEALTHVPWVASVEENSVVRALNDGAQSAFGVAKARADAPALDGDADGSAATYSNGDLVAAVIDTGIFPGHLDLDEGKVIAFKDFVNGQTTAYDDNGHGTHVAATIAGDGDARADGRYKGVAPAAALVGVKVLDANGSGTMAGVTAAIDWVVQNKDLYGIEVINLSLGASGCSDGTDATSAAVNNAHAAGLVVAVAAGNEGPGRCTIGTPGAAAGALTVGAMADTSALGLAQASFSSRGPTADGRIKPDVSAPGVNIVSAQTNTANGYVEYSGTSMATPFVAGVALLMRDASPALTSQQVKDKVVATAVDWGRGGDNTAAGSRGADVDYGAGRLDAYAALASAGAPLTAPPATPKHELRDGTLAGTGAVVDYKLEVTDVGFPIAATLIIPSLSAGSASSPDFDLYLYNPAGALVAASERVDRQEEVGYRPGVTGTYTLRVSSYSGSGSFFVDVSAGLGTAAAPAPPPAPTTVTAAASSVGLYSGSARSGDATRLASDDDAYFEVNSTTSGARTSDWYGRVRGVTNALRTLEVTYRGKSSATCNQAVFLYNWTTGVWVRLDARSAGTSEAAVTVAVTGSLADHVSGTSGDGDVAVRVRCTRGDYVNFFTSGDLLQITYQK